MTDEAGYNEPPEELGGDAVSVRVGRRAASWTDVHDWVTFSSVSPEARALYVVLRAHVNRQRADDLVWTSTLALALILGYSRGDKITKFIKELADLGAIEADRSGLHGRLEFVVNQEPTADYAGPRSMAEWHAVNKARLNTLRAEAKAKRDARRAKAKDGSEDQEAGSGEQKGSSGHVTPEQGEQGQGPAVPPDQGVPVTPDQGVPVTPDSGREPEVVEPDVLEPASVPASQVRRDDVARESDSPSGDDGQITITGEVERLPARRPAAEVEANSSLMGIARDWLDVRAKFGCPLVWGKAGDPMMALRGLVSTARAAGYSDDEIKWALCWADRSVPTAERLEAGLVQVRVHGWRTAPGWRPGDARSGNTAPSQRPSTTDARVNEGLALAEKYRLEEAS